MNSNTNLSNLTLSNVMNILTITNVIVCLCQEILFYFVGILGIDLNLNMNSYSFRNVF